MNWYKKAQKQKDILKENPYYMDIGHPEEQPEVENPMFLCFFIPIHNFLTLINIHLLSFWKFLF